MQVYKELRILTARPTQDDELRVPHLLYGVLSAQEACSAARWLELAKEAIDGAFAGNKQPIITGGTGLYIKALMEGLSPIPDIPQEARKQATGLWQERGEKALAAYDPIMSLRLKAGDTQRHIRALEVIIATGKSLAYWQEQPRNPPYPNVSFDINYISLPREELYARCDVRFTQMLKEGALEEVKALYALQLSADLPAMRAVGVPELIGVIEGRWYLEEATRHAQQATRNYAKRQITWFNNQLK
jgi:tRNA dimethylallyltransferase